MIISMNENNQNICKHCGVILSSEMSKCPLCGNKPGENSPVKTGAQKDYIYILRKKRNLWEAFGIIAVCLIAITILTNLIVDKELDWSLYASGGILLFWSYISIYLYARHYIMIWVTTSIIFTLGYLLLIDTLSSGQTWFIGIALPLTIAFFLLKGSFSLFKNHVKYHGFNLMGFALLHIAAFCLICEIFVDLFLYGQTELRWSLFIAISSIPVAIVLLFVHYRLKRGNNLKSFFHI